MINKEGVVHLTKYILYATSLIWMLYVVVFFHELGHAITVIAVGGTLHDFVVSWNLSGYVMWTWENVPIDSLPRAITLVAVSGGIGAALFFMVASFKTKWFLIPAIFSLLYGYGEVMCLADTRYNAAFGATSFTIIICLWLFWQFESHEIIKMKMARIGGRKRMRPRRDFNATMDVLEERIDQLENKYDRFRDLEEVMK